MIKRHIIKGNELCMAKFNRMDFLYQQWMNKWDSHPYLEELFLLWEGRLEPSVINESLLSCMNIFIYNTSTVYFYQYQNCFWLWMWIWYTEFHVFIFRSNVSYCPASWLSENSSKDTGSFQWEPVQNQGSASFW